MPDLGLPPWCSGPEEFISYHRSMLECDEVSSKLHHWIDITFGYKLLGEDAVKAKNVHLELTKDQTTLRRTGVTCLFRTPHPNRGSPSQSVYFGSTLPFHTLISCPKPTTATGAISSSTTDTTTVTSEGHDSSKDLNETQNPTCHFSDPVISHSLDNENCTLELPPDYDPLELINSYSHLCQFLATETHNTSLLEIPKIAEQSPHSVSLNDLFGRDIEAVACLVVELFTHPVFNYIEADQWSHEYRVSIARSSARTYWTRIPFFQATHPIRCPPHCPFGDRCRWPFSLSR
ncbi:unnamed protein product [Calicophoron daubneyi]|uniref:BEACH domain-containing protein n=1 Tax=Calicophoron daubneyi TaxID=300641 RepID=A0AAV2TT99_CALDB